MSDMNGRVVCDRCKRPPNVCYCDGLPSSPIETDKSHVLVLQHRHETLRRTAISSVPVLANVLDSATVVQVPKSNELVPGRCPELDKPLLHDSYNSILVLFPDPSAQPLADVLADSQLSQDKTLLVAIDGTWKEAKQLMNRNKELWEAAKEQQTARGKHFSFVVLPEDNDSIYGYLRREPKKGCISTLEAIAGALRLIESNEEASDALLTAFRTMVTKQDTFAAKGRQEKLEMYNGVSKEEELQKRWEQERQSKETSHSDSYHGSHTCVRDYVLTYTEVDFRQRQTLLQYGDVIHDNYRQVMAKCTELNRTRKRGNRLMAMSLEAFERQTGNVQEQEKEI